MKFTIEIEDFWLDEEELSSALKSYIKNDVVKKISENIKDAVEQEITLKINDVIKHKLSLVIDSTLTDLIATGIITKHGKETAITEHVKNLFYTSHGWSNPDRQMERLAKNFGDELKLQYNNAFANKIVSNMKEQGLLKDDVVQILLEGKPSE